MSTPVDFDICDPANRYEPCPKCGATAGMGLSFKGAPMHSTQMKIDPIQKASQ